MWCPCLVRIVAVALVGVVGDDDGVRRLGNSALVFDWKAPVYDQTAPCVVPVLGAVSKQLAPHPLQLLTEPSQHTDRRLNISIV